MTERFDEESLKRDFMEAQKTEPIRILPELRSAPGLLCLQCITEAEFAESAGEEAQDIREAVTFAPSWVSQEIEGQVAMACVTVPTCREHIRVERASARQIASRSGLALPSDGYR